MANPRILYDNRFDDGTPVASSTASGYSVNNVTDWRAYTWWKPTAGPSTITVDCGSVKDADYGVVYAEPGTYEVRGSTDNFGASDALLGTITIAATGLGLALFTRAGYRYWRVRSTTGTPAIAIVAIGVAVELPNQMEGGFDPLGRKIHGTLNRSVAGHPLGRVVNFEEWSERVTLNFVSWAWLRDTWLPMWRTHLRDNPFVLAWETNLYPQELRLVVVKDQFASPHKLGNYAELTVDLTGVVT